MPRRGERFPRTVPGDQLDPFGFPRMVGEFCEWMGTRGMSDKTIDDRHKLLGYLAGWLLERGITRPAEVTKPTLDSYQRWLFHYRRPDGKPLTFRSQHTYLVPVRAFFKWAARENRILYNPASELELPRIERRLPKHVLSVDEVEAVLAQPDLTEPTGVRDRAMLEVLYSTGIRRSELAHLELFDLDAERHTLLVRQGKGKKDRMVPIGERAIAWVDRYVNDVRPKLAPTPDDGTIFLTVVAVVLPVNRILSPFVEFRLEGTGDNYGPRSVASVVPAGADDACFRAELAAGLLSRDGNELPRAANADWQQLDVQRLAQPSEPLPAVPPTSESAPALTAPAVDAGSSFPPNAPVDASPSVTRDTSLSLPHSVSSSLQGRLPATGTDLRALVLAGAGALAVGAGLVRLARRRRRRA